MCWGGGGGSQFGVCQYVVTVTRERERGEKGVWRRDYPSVFPTVCV